MHFGSSDADDSESGGEDAFSLGSSWAAWQLGKSQQETRRPGAPAVTAYASQLYLTKRFSSLPPDVRVEQLQTVLHSKLGQLTDPIVDEGSFGSDVARYVRPGRPGCRGNKPPTRWRWRTNEDDECVVGFVAGRSRNGRVGRGASGARVERSTWPACAVASPNGSGRNVSYRRDHAWSTHLNGG